MDVHTDSDHGDVTDGDFRGTDDNCNSGSKNGPTEPNVIDGMDLDLAQDDNPSLVPPDQDSPSHILMALNDHCLYETFKRLHYLDLLNVVKVCVRFETQAKEAFASKYKELDLNIKDCDHGTMENILCTFGASIQSLHIHSNKITGVGDLFCAVIKNCSSELKKLILSNVDIQVNWPNLRLPFPNLEEFGLSNCTGNLDLAHLIDDCPSMKRIWLSHCDLKGINGMINRQFQKLETLQIMECDFDYDQNALEHFIVSNPPVTNLWFSPSRFRSSHAIRLIGQNMLNLQELYLYLTIDNLQHFQSDVQYIGQLRSLKTLQLDFNGQEIASLANALATNSVPIETLIIYGGSIDDIAVKYISQLKKITSLDICYVDGLNDEHLIELARSLPELQAMCLDKVTNEDEGDVPTIDGLMQMVHYAKKLNFLHLSFNEDDDDDYDDDTGFTINVDHFETMLSAIQNRPEKNPLRIFIRSNKSKLNVSDAILKENAEIFPIEIREIKYIYEP